MMDRTIEFLKFKLDHTRDEILADELLMKYYIKLELMAIAERKKVLAMFLDKRFYIDKGNNNEHKK